MTGLQENKMLKTDNGQRDLYSELLESLVREDHPYRKILEIVNFSTLLTPLHSLYSELGQNGLCLEKGFKALLLQHAEDLSYRELEKYLQENLAAKIFCGFGLKGETPDYSTLCKLKQRIGTERLTELFNGVVKQMREKNIVSDTFTFVDTTAIVTKIALWDERDKAIEQGLEKLNNTNVEKFAADKDARFGAKSKSKFWFGYKGGVSVDAKNGIITDVVATPANINDDKILEDILPVAGAILADKGFDTDKVMELLEQKGLHSMIIKKNNRKNKNKDLDYFITRIRSPFEGIFTCITSKKNKGGYMRTYFRGLSNVNFQLTFKALACNLFRLAKIKNDLCLQGVIVS